MTINKTAYLIRIEELGKNEFMTKEFEEILLFTGKYIYVDELFIIK